MGNKVNRLQNYGYVTFVTRMYIKITLIYVDLIGVGERICLRCLVCCSSALGEFRSSFELFDFRWELLKNGCENELSLSGGVLGDLVVKRADKFYLGEKKRYTMLARKIQIHAILKFVKGKRDVLLLYVRSLVYNGRVHELIWWLLSDKIYETLIR